MKIPKLKKHDKVDIVWQDTYDPVLSTWADDKEIMEKISKENTKVDSRGSFYCEHDNMIYIYGDKLDDLYSRITGISRGSILKIKKEKK
jgi:hypothetical protein